MRKRIAMLVALVLYATLLAGLAQAQVLPPVKPELVGLSGERLGQLSGMLKADIDKGVFPARRCWWRDTARSRGSRPWARSIRRAARP